MWAEGRFPDLEAYVMGGPKTVLKEVLPDAGSRGVEMVAFLMLFQLSSFLCVAVFGNTHAC